MHDLDCCFVKVSSSQKIGAAGKGRKPAGKSSTVDYSSSSMPYDYSRKYDEINKMSSSSVSDDGYEDAASEKELVGDFPLLLKNISDFICWST